MAHRGTIIAVSRCSTAEEFQNAFRRYAEPTALFIPTPKPFASADTAYLHVCLNTGETLLEGEIEVRSSVDRVAGLYGRPGMTVRFISPDAPNKEMLTHLVRARTMLKPVPLPEHLTARPALASLNKAAVTALSPAPPPSVTDAVLQLAECALVDAQGYELGAFAGSEFTSTKMTPIVPVEPRSIKASVAPNTPAVAAAEGAGMWRGEGTQLVPVAPVAEAAATPSQHVISAVNATPGTWAPDSTRTEVSPNWEGDDDVAPPPAAATADDDDDLEAVSTNVVSKAAISQVMQTANKQAVASAAVAATPPPDDDTSTTGTVSPPGEGMPRADTSIPPPIAEPQGSVPDIIQTLKGVPAVQPRMRAESLAPDALVDDDEDDQGNMAFGGPTNPRAEAMAAVVAPPPAASPLAPMMPMPDPEQAVPAAALRSYNGAQPLNVAEFHSARASVTLDAVMPMPEGRMHRGSLAPGGVTLSSASLRGTVLAPKRRGAKTIFIALGVVALVGAAAFAVWYFVLRTNDAPAPVASSAPRPARARPAPEPPVAAEPAGAVPAAAAAPPQALQITADAGPATAATPAATPAAIADDAPAAPETPTTAVAAKPAAAVKTPKCKVTFAGLPPTATLVVDGAKLGSARKVKSLPCGDVEATISAPQFADKVVKFKLKPGAKNAQTFQLARPQFETNIISKPAGAQVRINGKLAGKTPMTKALTGFEPQQIELRKPGYKPKSVKVVPKAKATLEYPLAKQ